MKIVLAPDSFKGAASAVETANAMEKGILSVFPKAECVLLPMADGGEGTVETLVTATNGKFVKADVFDPLMRKIKAEYGILGDNQTAVIEMAAASGLPLLKEDERDPQKTSTFGTGELIKHGLDSGCRKFIIGIGGSATTDGGAGMASALGIKFLDSAGKRILPSGENLIRIQKIDFSGLVKEVRESSFLTACDVTNPLTGRDGAARVYGPQKGASPEAVEILEKNLIHFANVVRSETGVDNSTRPGTGAAGGLGFGLTVFLNAELTNGSELIKSAMDFDRKIKGADLILTGEGKIDKQTLYGKTIAGVAKSAKKYGIPCIALGGICDISADKASKIGITSIYCINPDLQMPEKAIKNTLFNLCETTERVIRVFFNSRL